MTSLSFIKLLTIFLVQFTYILFLLFICLTFFSCILYSLAYNQYIVKNKMRIRYIFNFILMFCTFSVTRLVKQSSVEVSYKIIILYILIRSYSKYILTFAERHYHYDKNHKK